MKIAVVFDTPWVGWEDGDFRREMAAEVEEAEYDIAQALITSGHEVVLIGVHDDFQPMVERLRAFGPDLVFNCAEGFHDTAGLDYVFAAVLEAERCKYTGSPPLGLLLTRNKATSKEVLAYHGIRVPGFTTFPVGEPLQEPRLTFPLIVKPIEEDASVGIAKASVVQTPEALAERVAFVHQRFGQAAIAEEFIDGRELYVSVLGNRDRLDVLPIIEMTFDKTRTRPVERIATKAAKWDEPYRDRMGIKNVFARPIAQVARDRIDEVCRTAFRALALRDYARFDIRLTPDNEVWVLEANANPYISFGHDTPNAAEKAGMTYETFIERIVLEAMGRYAVPA